MLACKETFPVSYKCYKSSYKTKKKSADQQRPVPPRWYLSAVQKHLLKCHRCAAEIVESESESEVPSTIRDRTVDDENDTDNSQNDAGHSGHDNNNQEHRSPSLNKNENIRITKRRNQMTQQIPSNGNKRMRTTTNMTIG